MDFSKSFRDRFTDAPIEELTREIGNEFTFNLYNKLPGNDAKEKAELLQKEFKKIKSKKVEELELKDIFSDQGDLNRNYFSLDKFLDREKHLLILDKTTLPNHVLLGLERGTLSINDIKYIMIKAQIRYTINRFVIKNDYSVVFTYEGETKLLIYNS